MVNSARGRVFLFLLVAFIATVSIIWILQNRFGYQAREASIPPSEIAGSQVAQLPPREPASTASLPIAELSPEVARPNPEETPNPEPSPSPKPELTLEPSYVGRLDLAVPVKGVKLEQLQDTFRDARSEGRVHDAIDIPAPAGTPVIASAEGDIIKLFQSERGGTTIYQLSKDKKLIFYYAHLQGYAPGLTEGKRVWQGETIGYVGDTGNAGPGNYHLHFSIMVTNDPKRYWEGTNINPYPLLRKK